MQFVIVGLFPETADDPSIFVPIADLLVSLCARSVALGALAGHGTRRPFPRQKCTIGVMNLFTLCNLIAAFVQGYRILRAARMVACRGARRALPDGRDGCKIACGETALSAGCCADVRWPHGRYAGRGPSGAYIVGNGYTMVDIAAWGWIDRANFVPAKAGSRNF